MSHQYKLDAKEVASRAKGKWDAIYASLAPILVDAMAHPGRHGPCPIHGGTDGFRLHKYADNGAGICNSCPEFNNGGTKKWMDGLSILMWINGSRFPEMLEDVARIVAPDLLREDRRYTAPRLATPPKYVPPPRTEAMIKDDRDVVQRMREVWGKAIPISAPEAEVGRRYFEARGLPVPSIKDGLDNELRFVPSLYYRDKDGKVDHFPAIVAMVRNAEGNARAIHRIYLARDGRGKAPVAESKKLMAKPDVVSLHTCAVRLGPPSKVIAVAEGIETALAVRAFTGFSCWATVNSTLMRLFLPPAGTTAVHIFGDLDRSEEGARATHDLGEELKSRGFQIRADLPPGPIPVGQKSLDWLDVYQRYGAAAIDQVGSLRAALAKRKVIPFPIGSRRAG